MRTGTLLTYVIIGMVTGLYKADAQTPLNLAQLAQVYSSDPTSADTEFKGKRLSVQGMVDEVDSNQIVLIAPNIGRVVAKFGGQNLASLQSIQSNRTIALSCIIDGTGFYMVEMSDCHSVPLALPASEIPMPTIRNSLDTDCAQYQPCTDEQFQSVVSDLQHQWVLVPQEIRSKCISQTTYPMVMRCILNATLVWLTAHPNDAAPWVNPTD